MNGLKGVSPESSGKPEPREPVTVEYGGKKWTVTTQREGTKAEIQTLVEHILNKAFEKAKQENVSFTALKAFPELDEKYRVMKINIDSLDKGSDLHAIIDEADEQFGTLARFFGEVMPVASTPAKPAGIPEPVEVREKPSTPAQNEPAPPAARASPKELEEEKKEELKRAVDELVGILKSWGFRRTKRFNKALDQAVERLQITEKEAKEKPELVDFVKKKDLKKLIQSKVENEIRTNDKLKVRLETILGQE